MTVSGIYRKTGPELDGGNNNEDYTVWCINNNNNNKKEEKVYNYDEAIDLAGNGFYIFSLLGALMCAYMGMAFDMFGFSIVVSSACDLHLTHFQKTVLLSIPFVGAVVMAYPWGYIADTQGRLKSLSFSLLGSFILASASVFSPNWIVLAVLKFGSTSLCSGIQSLGITLLGESCSQKLKGPLQISIATCLLFVFAAYSVWGYFILNFEFTFDLGFITFSPWRLLALVLTFPLGVSLVLSVFFLESPKFLLNAGKEEEALKILKKICERNGGDAENYPVKRVKLNETARLKSDHIPFLQSLRDQTLPLFKPPLLSRTLKLFYITLVIYSVNNGFFSWIPFVVDSFYSDESNSTEAYMCDMIVNSNKLDNSEVCIGNVKSMTVWVSIIQGTFYTLLNILVIAFSNRKKIMMMTILMSTFCCGVLIPVVSGRMLIIGLFYGFLANGLCISIIFSYYVDLFPTSYRGMAACLGVMVARVSALIGTNLVGSYLSSQCAASYYSWAAFSFSGAIVTWFLPSDNPKKEIS